MVKEAAVGTASSYLTTTEHVCGCGHRCMTVMPIGTRYPCAHICRLRKP